MKKIIWVLLVSVIYSCKSSKNLSANNFIENKYISIAVNDFLKKTKSSKKHPVFIVSVSDSIGAEGELVGVAIGEFNYKLNLSDGLTSGGNNGIKVGFKEIDGNLFFWRSSTYSDYDSSISIFKKFNVLMTADEVNSGMSPGSFSWNKGTHYYFCKNNVTKFKRLKSRKGIGYYQAPLIKCE